MKKFPSISKKILYGTLISFLFISMSFAYTITTPRVTAGTSLTVALWDLIVDDLLGLMTAIDTNITSITTNATNIAANTSNITATMPTGAVLYFNLSSCPAGWSPLNAAQGRYLVGLPSGGSLGAAVGNSLSNLENRPVGRHTHAVSDPGHSHGIEQVSGSDGITWSLSRGASGTSFIQSTTDTTGIAINNSGDVNGTNAPYLQLLVCEKD